MDSKGIRVAAVVLLVGAGLVVGLNALLREPETQPRAPEAPAPPPVGEPAAASSGRASPPSMIAAPAAPPTSPRVAAPPAMPPAPPSPATSGLVVVEAVLCKGVDRENRKPEDVTREFHVADGRMWCFAKLAGGAGRQARAVWRLAGKAHPGALLKAGQEGALTWRTWWYKDIDDDMAGEGSVDLEDDRGSVLKTLPVRVVR